MPFARCAQTGLRVDRFDPHLPHQASHPDTTGTITERLEFVTHTAASVGWLFQIDPVDALHEEFVSKARPAYGFVVVFPS